MSWRIIEGDCRDVLAALPERSVHTVVTSPPYFGLRDYGASGQIGLEPSPDEFVGALVGVFREVRRVLRDDGTVWLNLGDSFCSTDKWGGGKSGNSGKHTTNGEGVPSWAVRERSPAIPGVKPKDLIGIPWMVAFALRADGWYLRSDIIWAKPNPMPESVTDRPTKAHEYVFLLSKGPRYFYDADTIREAHQGSSVERYQYGGSFNGGQKHDDDGSHWGDQFAADRKPAELNPAGRNKRSVWTVATQPYAGAHFATFPPKLIEPCILAGCPERCCGVCGAPWERVVERTGVDNADNEVIAHDGVPGLVPRTSHDRVRALDGKNYQHARRGTDTFEPSCGHNAEPTPGTVLDPFAGAGTTGMVALRHNRSFVGIELNEEYAQMARERIIADCPLHNHGLEAVA